MTEKAVSNPISLGMRPLRRDGIGTRHGGNGEKAIELLRELAIFDDDAHHRIENQSPVVLEVVIDFVGTEHAPALGQQYVAFQVDSFDIADVQ